MLPWLSLVACKAVLTAAATAGCRSIELDLQVAPDGAWVLSHEPVDAAGRASVQDFDAFVAGLRGRRFALVNLDVKERGLLPGDGRLSTAMKRHAAALASLAAQADDLVITSPVPARYEEIARFVARERSRAVVGYELADYTAAEARRWNLPLSTLEAWLLPFGSAANRLYLAWRGRDVRWLVVQESTAAAVKPESGRSLICWTRDPAAGAPPPDCRYTVRAR